MKIKAEDRDQVLGVFAATVGEVVTHMDAMAKQNETEGEITQEVRDLVALEIADTRAMALGFLTIARELQDEEYLLFLANTLREMASGPMSVKMANKRAEIVEKMKSGGLGEALGSLIGKGGMRGMVLDVALGTPQDDCQCEKCVARRAREAAAKEKPADSGDTLINPKS